MAIRYQSRLASVEEKRNIKNATRIVIITIVTMVLLVFFGIPVLGRFAGFVSDLAKGDKPIAKNDKTPPAPPQISIPPKFTNQKALTLEGQSEENSIVKLTLNDRESEIATDVDGKFKKEISLLDGENVIVAKAIDQAGNESLLSPKYTIVFDDKNPEITIDSPADGSSYYGSSQKNLDIIGKTESGASLYINSRFVSVGEDGSFKFTTQLGEGENKFNLKSTDQSQNYTEMDIVVNFTP